MLRFVNRVVVLPTVGFGLGVGTFLKAWPTEAGAMSLNDEDLTRTQRMDVVEKIERNEAYRRMTAETNCVKALQSDGIPAGHRPYHVGQGILFGEQRLEIDPIILKNESREEIAVFYHLGKELGNENGKVHKGVLSLLLDEALCYCGFPKLPSKRGVTARLNIEFEKDIPADSTVVLRAKVVKAKGRKCVIEGTLESLPSNYLVTQLLGPTVYARAECILVEPKWFKHFSRLHIF